ncbi:hypothetical protein CCM_06174 [Cordyceps militaris CM01]|uniref:Uncharacterized protein n=1 Tax=Cordyceps militaris (strain CM01) TaxID=983644 RepID=G3JJ72_CORMM|nr:uncharacterized protein CCM_06174 [Cordyceps militaris CM01]EGX92014.1 hypothetical protein CCM_06174 [Cordyceps militaris CM01]
MAAHLHHLSTRCLSSHAAGGGDMGCSNALPAITIQQLAREVESVRGHTSANLPNRSDAEMPQTTDTTPLILARRPMAVPAVTPVAILTQIGGLMAWRLNRIALANYLRTSKCNLLPQSRILHIALIIKHVPEGRGSNWFVVGRSRHNSLECAPYFNGKEVKLDEAHRVPRAWFRNDLEEPGLTAHPQRMNQGMCKNDARDDPASGQSLSWVEVVVPKASPPCARAITFPASWREPLSVSCTLATMSRKSGAGVYCECYSDVGDLEACDSRASRLMQKAVYNRGRGGTSTGLRGATGQRACRAYSRHNTVVIPAGLSSTVVDQPVPSRPAPGGSDALGLFPVTSYNSVWSALAAHGRGCFFLGGMPVTRLQYLFNLIVTDWACSGIRQGVPLSFRWPRFLTKVRRGLRDARKTNESSTGGKSKRAKLDPWVCLDEFFPDGVSAEQCRTVNSVTAYHLVASFSPLRLGFPPLPASSEAKLANTEGWWKLQCVLGQERERDAVCVFGRQCKRPDVDPSGCMICKADCLMAPKCHHDHSPNGLSLMAARPVVVCLHNKKRNKNKRVLSTAYWNVGATSRGKGGGEVGDLYAVVMQCLPRIIDFALLT